MPKRKEIIHAPATCGGVMHVCFTDTNIPYLQCEKCSYVIKDWIDWENRYKGLWELEDNWKDKKNHLACLLGYFCARYEDYYNTKYTLSLNDKGLFRGPEINILRRVLRMLHSDPWLVKDYIDFIFETKVKHRKKKITSLSILAYQPNVQSYLLMREHNKKVDRNTPLPASMIKWINKFTPEVYDNMALSDFGDLHLLLTHYKTGVFQENKAIEMFLTKLKKCNYIDDNFQISNWREL